MNVLTVRAKVKEENVADVEAGAGKLFAALEQAQPGNVRYASTKLPDGVTFVVLLQVAEGTDNPLPELPAFREFQENLKTWVAEPPSAEQLTIVGTYRLFD